MTAHITVELRASLYGDPVLTVKPRGSDVGDVMPGLDNLDDPVLRLVDPYDLTVFSSNQMFGLIPELQRLHEETHHQVLGQVVELAERARREGYYLVFIGD